MKLSFSVLLLAQGQNPVNLFNANGPYSGSKKCQSLVDIAMDCGIEVHSSIERLESLSTEEAQSRVVFVAGDPAHGQLSATLKQLDVLGMTPVIVVDALPNFLDIQKELTEIVEQRFQVGVVNQVKGMVKTPRLMLYQFGKSDVTTTIFVVIGAGTKDARVLTIVRDRMPFKGKLAFPGGFLDNHIESLLGCASREGMEETSVSVPPEELVLLDVRSGAARDDRGHVIDHGYMWLVPKDKEAAVLASVQAGDDAQAGSAGFTLVTDLLQSREMAFDHYDMLLAAVRTGLVLPPARLVLRLVRGVQGFFARLASRLERSDAVYARYH